MGLHSWVSEPGPMKIGFYRALQALTCTASVTTISLAGVLPARTNPFAPPQKESESIAGDITTVPSDSPSEPPTPTSISPAGNEEREVRCAFASLASEVVGGDPDGPHHVDLESVTCLDAEKLNTEPLADHLSHVRTRIYFTSESHIHSLVNVLRYAHLVGGGRASLLSKEG